MKKISILLAILFFGALAFQSCEDMDDNAVPVQDFIWKGLNLYYLWKDDVPDLADNRFANQEQLNSFLESFSSPENLFRSLLYKPGEVDRFSVIFPDFRVLENALQGIVKSNGVEFGLVYTDESQTGIIGYVRYILPGSDAAGKNIQRGDIFYAVNGTPLTVDNYQSLLGSDNYTLHLADYNGGDITPNGEEVFLTKAEYAENPVYSVKIFQEGNHTIGYIMYNGFFSNYNNDINAAFGELKAAGVTDLVLDLRYNSGGSVRTATYLASMITGDFTNQLFSKQQWNQQVQEYYESENPSALVENFTASIDNGPAINSLMLPRVYILTTRSTASASELVINGLEPYIDVITIGTTTTGKNVGSVTLYDSPDFSKNNREGSHRYAMQPIVLKIVNKAGFGDYTQGLSPDYPLPEDLGNLGAIGDPEEPLLSSAIGLITGSGRPAGLMPDKEYRNFKDSKNMRRFGTELYIEDVPLGGFNLIKKLN